jgi:hypothetical protein
VKHLMFLSAMFSITIMVTGTMIAMLQGGYGIGASIFIPTGLSLPALFVTVKYIESAK